MGVDEVTISEILGYASPTITNRLYGHVTPLLREAAAAKMDAILLGSADPTGSQMAALAGSDQRLSQGSSL